MLPLSFQSTHQFFVKLPMAPITRVTTSTILSFNNLLICTFHFLFPLLLHQLVKQDWWLSPFTIHIPEGAALLFLLLLLLFFSFSVVIIFSGLYLLVMGFFNVLTLIKVMNNKTSNVSSSFLIWRKLWFCGPISLLARSSAKVEMCARKTELCK